MREPSIRVLHVVSTNERRGAEMFVADLLGAIDGPIEQRVAVLRDAGRPPLTFGPALAMAGPNRVLPVANVNIGTGLALRRLVRSWRPTVLLAHGGEALKYVAGVGGSRATTVYRRVGATPTWMAGELRARIYGALMRRVDLTIAVSDATRRDAIATFGLDPVRTLMIPNGVDRRRIEPTRTRDATRAALGIGAGERVVLFVGALNAEKDPLLAVDVARRAFTTVPEATMLMVGEGPFRAEVAARCEQAGPSGKITLLGSRTDVGDLMAASDVFLLTSRTEGMPGVVIEAGMAGLPVVGHVVGGVNEVVIDGETGLLAPFGDAEGLTAGLVRVLSDADVRARLGAAARDRCRERFDVRAVAGAYEELFRMTSEGRPEPARRTAEASSS